MEFSSFQCYSYGRELSERQARREIMSIKRVILANHSRLFLEMFQRVLNKNDRLEVVQEIMVDEELPFAIQRLCPDWVIVSLPLPDPILNWISAFMQNDLSVRFVFFSEDYRNITMKWQTAFQRDLSDLSLKEFIYILEKDLQQIG
jgi:hypothetical protein